MVFQNKDLVLLLSLKLKISIFYIHYEKHLLIYIVLFLTNIYLLLDFQIKMRLLLLLFY